MVARTDAGAARAHHAAARAELPQEALRLSHDVRFVAIPTTYSGSEMTTIWGISDGGAKKTGRDPKVLPKTVIYDPELTVALPVACV